MIATGDTGADRQDVVGAPDDREAWVPAVATPVTVMRQPASPGGSRADKGRVRVVQVLHTQPTVRVSLRPSSAAVSLEGARRSRQRGATSLWRTSAMRADARRPPPRWPRHHVPPRWDLPRARLYRRTRRHGRGPADRRGTPADTGSPDPQRGRALHRLTPHRLPPPTGPTQRRPPERCRAAPMNMAPSGAGQASRSVRRGA